MEINGADVCGLLRRGGGGHRIAHFHNTACGIFMMPRIPPVGSGVEGILFLPTAERGATRWQTRPINNDVESNEVLTFTLSVLPIR